MDGQSVITMFGFGLLTFNSGLAIYNSWGDNAAPFMAFFFVLLFLWRLNDFERGRRGEGAARINMDGQYSALAKVGLAVLNCNMALDAYSTRRGPPGPGSAALVLVSYAVLVILTGLFVRAFARAHGGELGQEG